MTVSVLPADVDRGTLLHALEENLWAFWRDYGYGPDAELHEGADLRWFASGIPLAVFNGIQQVRLDENSVKPTIGRMQASVDRRGVPAMWWIGPNSRPADLADRLERHGLTLARTMVGMTVDLTDLDTALDTPVDFRIEQVHGPEMQRLWARLVGEGSGFGPAAAQALADLEPRLSDPTYLRKPRYVGFLSGRPMATAALVLAAGVAGVYAVSTLPAERRRGIGTAMTALPLLNAQAQGYRVGILQATAMGLPVYRRLGFRDACEYRCYGQAPTSKGN
jgi:GNAT superfamily N-acetyltransferase